MEFVAEELLYSRTSYTSLIASTELNVDSLYAICVHHSEAIGGRLWRGARFVRRMTELEDKAFVAECGILEELVIPFLGTRSVKNSRIV